ncbi:MAG: vitamin B12-dependent ribonucleotide reductase [Deltaproteobacteria bacterium]|nr:vitamin B12-dependent ribonucleotide reductase [Deltaproteobacteria bacterium]
MEQDVYSRLLSKSPAKAARTAKKSGHESRPRININENALRVLEKRYLRKDADGKPVETVEEMFWRVASNIAEADRFYDPASDTEALAEAFYGMMTTLEFMPNSPTLMNAGRELQQLSACFVLPVEDSMESIFEAVKHTALIHKSGGGTGFSFSRLRPSGDTVGSTSGISSGPISFMTVFDSATEAIKQGGTRRGANMGILRVDHPDIMNFITCKEDNARLNNFNISVSLTEDFMEALEVDGDYDIINPRTKGPMSRLKAREVFDKIVKMAWRNGDPGIIYIDRMNADNPTPHVGEIESTNPCGEQPLLPYESCNLGSINLSRMLMEDGDGYEIDWARLGDTVEKSVHFLDNVIDMNKYPIEQISRVTKSNRKIGLGVMGFADMLIRLAVPYDSETAIKTAEKVMSFIHEKGKKASEELALKRGSFPNFKGSVYDGKVGAMRNATVTTIAPTGTISIISGCSSGIEPLFALAFTRNVMEGTELLEVNPLLEEISRERGFDSPEIMKEVAARGTLHGVKNVPEEIMDIFVTSHDISPEWHIKMQAAFQKYTDNAVSKTVNFPNSATIEDVAEVYISAYKLGCKGVTVYRDGSRDVQVLTKGSEKPAPKVEVLAEREPAQAATPAKPKARGEIAFGVTKKIKTGCGNLYVTINEDEEGRPLEIFTQIGKAGGCVASQCEAMGRMTSLALRSGIQAEEIVKQMRGISCHLPVGYGGGKVMSCSDAMAQAMDWYLGLKRNTGAPLSLAGANNLNFENSKLDFTLAPEILKRGACPDCGGSVEHSDGCLVCRGCGYSECG